LVVAAVIIDEDKLFPVKGWLFSPQGLAGRGDIRPILLRCMEAFFKGRVDVVEEPRNPRLPHLHLLFRQASLKFRERTIRLLMPWSPAIDPLNHGRGAMPAKLASWPRLSEDRSNTSPTTLVAESGPIEFNPAKTSILSALGCCGAASSIGKPCSS
jgi:hypothetical protein